MKKQNITTLIFIFSAFLMTILMIIIGNKTNNILIQSLSQATPILAVLIVSIVITNKKNFFKTLGINNCKNWKWYLLSFLIPIASIFISYFIGSIFGMLKLKISLISFITISLRGTVLLIPIVGFWALCEEIGWRGFLQQNLIHHFGLKKGLIFTGIIWSAWHYSFILMTPYYSTGNKFVNLTLFTITVTLMSIVMGLIRLKSNSIWPVILFHAESNIALDLCNNFFKVESSNWIYFSGEAGIINILFWAAIVFSIYICHSKYCNNHSKSISN